MVNRDLQLKIMQKLKEGGLMEHTHFFLREIGFTGTFNEVSFNLRYLNEHQLIEGASAVPTLYRQGDNMVEDYTDPGATMVKGRITVKGVDFLENDGGLTAILGVVTIKFHQDTLSELETMIQLDKTLPPEEKATLLQKLRNLPEEGAKTLVQELVKAGLRRTPDGWNTAINYLNGIPWA